MPRGKVGAPESDLSDSESGNGDPGENFLRQYTTRRGPISPHTEDRINNFIGFIEQRFEAGNMTADEVTAALTDILEHGLEETVRMACRS